MTTSHLTNPAKDAGQVIGYSHSTRLSAEELLIKPLAIPLGRQKATAKWLVMAGHPKDDSQVAGYSRAKDTPTLTLPRRERGRLLLPPPGEGWDEGSTACVVRFASRSMRSIGNRTAYPLRVQPP